MNKNAAYLTITIILLTIVFLVFSGCVEVTPPTGTRNATAYAGVNTSGNITEGLEKRTVSPDGTSSPSDSSQSEPIHTDKKSTVGPQEKLPTPPVQGVVQVTPRSLEGLVTSIPTQSYSSKSSSASISHTDELITIYEINHTFVNDAVAYAYLLETPPLYIELGFNPVMGTDVISYQKRTGDKEGQLEVTVNRPLKDAWFEMRVYEKNESSIMLKEGFGKTYSQGNKSVVLRKVGSYQFDFVGNYIDANIKLKVPRSLADLSLLAGVTDMIAVEKQESTRIPAVYLIDSDLPDGWVMVGTTTRSDTIYQSMYNNEGITLRQKITRFTSTDNALTELEKIKTEAGSDSSGPSLIGQGGFAVDKSQIKTQLVFVEGLYLVELASFTPPNPVPLSTLQEYGRIIISRIQTTG